MYESFTYSNWFIKHDRKTCAVQFGRTIRDKLKGYCHMTTMLFGSQHCYRRNPSLIILVLSNIL